MSDVPNEDYSFKTWASISFSTSKGTAWIIRLPKSDKRTYPRRTLLRQRHTGTLIMYARRVRVLP